MQITSKLILAQGEDRSQLYKKVIKVNYDQWKRQPIRIRILYLITI